MIKSATQEKLMKFDTLVLTKPNTGKKSEQLKKKPQVTQAKKSKIKSQASIITPHEDKNSVLTTNGIIAIKPLAL